MPPDHHSPGPATAQARHIPPPARPPPPPPPVQPPPPPIPLRLAEPVIPRNADDVIHNVIVRQLLEDQNNPNTVQNRANCPVLAAMRRVVDTYRDGQSIVALKPLIE